MKNKILSKIIFVFFVLFLPSCSTYSNKFKCRDARGLGCVMLSDVANQISSGQIEEIYKNNKKCFGKKCFVTKKYLKDEVPSLASTHKTTIRNLESISDEDISDENNLYF